MKDKETIMKALAACSNFCCCECPYQYLDDKEYSFRCIHTLVEDVNEMLKEINKNKLYDEQLVTGVEDGWIKVDKETWKQYLEAKERLN